MDSNASDPFEGPFDIPEPESGSAYENSDSDFEQESPDKGVRGEGEREREQAQNDDIPWEGESDSYSNSLPNISPDNQYTDEWISADALKWAATFVPPEVGGIPIPARGAYGLRSKKRKLKQSIGNSARAKRLKTFYSKDYCKLLNNEIYDAAARSIHEDNIPLEDSQIGCSMWSADEKDLFFTGLSRIGRDNVRAIAARIGTKSEVEVQEYMHILHQALKEKKLYEARLLDFTEFPAAAELSFPECYALLERAADGLASRQERYEEDVEEAKWGNYWLLTKEVSKSLENKRSTSKLKDDEGVQGLLPAISLLNLKNWLALSERVFMNPTQPGLEDNWRQIGEPGENPAIRATAFDDFYSLTVSVTKRLISTVLFCTMSRIRAMDSKKTKAADININDVEAATKILKMDANSNEFWIKCARRNHLSISHHDKLSNSIMTYPEVETELSKECNEKRRRSRSCSHPRFVDPAEDLSEVYTSSDGSLLDTDIGTSSDSDTSSHLDDNPFTQKSPSQPQSQSQARSQRKHLSPEAYEEALEAHVSAFDARASKLEEQRIWRLLGKDPPLHLKTKPDDDELPERPARKNGGRGREQWGGMERKGILEERIGRRERRKRLREGRDRKWMAMRTRTTRGGDDSGVESGSNEDGGDEANTETVITKNGRHDKGEEPEKPPKHRSYAVYNSGDD
ncbi:hypothetical protein DID88_006284 [Monilinia fructigena]|uniref:Myb-like domain-containing protein n=1 Tax=Monilinia fructigena TaxID=38457 RepID=A0A395J3D4_9HELO|nr:hypothetical protein DID88_006284 [Monilinia fructigena]